MDPNTAIYTVSYTYQSPAIADNKLFVSTAPIIYDPEDKTTKVKPKPTKGHDLSGTYYHVHNYVHFINLVNKALAVALSNLKRVMPQNNQGVSLIELAAAPYLDFDPTTNRVILHAHHSSLTRWRQRYKDTIISKFTLTRDYTICSLGSRTKLYHLKASWTTDWGSCITITI